MGYTDGHLFIRCGARPSQRPFPRYGGLRYLMLSAKRGSQISKKRTGALPGGQVASGWRKPVPSAIMPGLLQDWRIRYG